MVRRRLIALNMLLAAVLAAAVALAAPPADGPRQDQWLEAALEPAQVYVQAQAIYRLRFYQAIDVRDLQMTGPSTRLADVRQIGPERVFEALRAGQRYRVHERSYAVFPFGSGALELSGAHVLGRVAAVAAPAADGRQAMRLEAPVQTLTVQPTPAAAAGAPWLPAQSLTLSESWSPDVTEARPGQALRRSIRIEAVGIDAGQIPPLQVAAPGMRVDAEAPRIENRLAGERNIGVREQTYQLVALRAGTVLVPELKLYWWNLATDTLASATLPARTLQFAPADMPTAGALPLTRAASSSSSPTPAPLPSASKRWLWLVAAILLCAAMALAYARRVGVRAARRLRRVGRLGNAGAVRDDLLQWAAAIWPQVPPATLPALAERWPDPAAHRALASLERCLYGPQRGHFDAATLNAIVRAVRQFRGP